MAFPTIRHCVVCTESSLEDTGLPTFVGVYGLAPYVEIWAQRLEVTFTQLCFVLMGGPGTGKHYLRTVITDPLGKTRELHWTGIDFGDLDEREAIINLRIPNMLVSHTGVHRVQVFTAEEGIGGNTSVAEASYVLSFETSFVIATRPPTPPDADTFVKTR